MAQRHLGTNRKEQLSSEEKLSSGSRINQASDDAAGLSIATKLKANVRSNAQALRNANDAVSMLQTAEGAMNEVGNILVRFRELSVQAASDTIGDTERGFLDREMQQLEQELGRISRTTEYDGVKLLGAQGPKLLEIQVGSGDDPNADRFFLDLLQTRMDPARLGLQGMSIRTKLDAQQNLARIDEAIRKVSGTRATIGALQNRIGSNIDSLQIYNENLSAAKSRIKDTDYATQTSENTRTGILANAGIAVLAQANTNGQLALKLLG